MTFNVIVADTLAQEGLDAFAALENVSVENAAGIARSDLLACIGNFDALVVRSRTHADAEMITAGSKLQIIGRAGIGVDNIDVPAATRAGVIVMNTPDGNTTTTAEHTISLMMSLARHIPLADASLKAGRWDKKKFVGRELKGKTVGVLGLGNIGRIVAARCLALGMHVVGYDPYFDADKAAELGIDLLDLDVLLPRVDILTVHTPLTAETRGLIGAAELQKMRPGVMLVNCARGGLYDEAALLAGLESEHLGGVALDVFEQEPPAKDNPLVAHPRVVATPHLGASTQEAQVAVAVAMAEQIGDFANGSVARSALNLPAISVAELRVLAPYLNLVDAMGSFASQLTDASIQGLIIRIGGTLNQYPVGPLSAGAVSGVLRRALDRPVNAVNALLLAKERGLEVTTASSSREFQGYDGLIELSLKSQSGSVSVAGAIFGGKQLRFVSVNGVALEVIPEGSMLVIANQDKPGVIGQVGAILGEAGINIARMQLGLSSVPGMALSVVNIGSTVPAEVITQLLACDLIESVQQVHI